MCIVVLAFPVHICICVHHGPLQCRPRSDTAEHNVWSIVARFAMTISKVETGTMKPYWEWFGEAKVSCILLTWASNWYWLTVWQGLLSLQQVWVEGECLFFFYFFCFFTFIPLHFLFLPCPSLHLLYYIFYLFSLSLGDVTKWATRVNVSLNSKTESINLNFKVPITTTADEFYFSEKIRLDISWISFFSVKK